MFRFFFFKQKTAYEMRISDWSSDVCSSDLTTRAAQAAPTTVIDREITVRFDANVASGLPWRFTAPKTVKLRLGEERLVAYKGKNIGNGPYLGTAAFTDKPFKTGENFIKIESLCFTEQLYLPGEEQIITVRFFAEPQITENLKQTNDFTL